MSGYRAREGAPRVAMREAMKQLGDFTAGARLLWICCLGTGIGLLCAVVARVLLSLIALFTNLFYYQHLSLELHRPADAVLQLGLVSVLIPVAGSLIIGLMARFGSERIRGHGIPEALEAIL